MRNFTTKSAFLKSTCQNVKTLKVDELFIKKVIGGIFCDFTTILNDVSDNKKTNDAYQFPVAKIDELGVVKIYQPLSDDSILTSSQLKKQCVDETSIFISYNGGEKSIKNIEQLKNGVYFFYKAGITTFDKQLTSLEMGNNMFQECKLLTSFDTSLSGLTDGHYMFYKCSSLTSFNGSLSGLTNGYYMFHSCSSLTSFDTPLDNLSDGSYMFYNCSSLTSFDSSLNGLTNGSYMFYICSSLTSFDSSLSSLTNGTNMFCKCSSLTSFNSSLSNLTNGSYMFSNCSSLTSFNTSLNSLTNGTGMFYYCFSLTSFNSLLSSLTRGYYMFYNCSSLTSFNSSLNSLTDGTNMFYKCKLDLASVQNIASSINDLASQSKSGKIYIGISSSIKDNSSLTTALTTIRNKGWTVTEQYN